MTLQYIRPDADSVDGTWLNASGNNTDLFDSLNESSFSDADYIKSSATDGDVVRLRLSDPSSALASPGVIRFRCKREGLDETDLTVRLKEGTTVIATWEYGFVTDSFVTVEEALTGTQMAAITDPTNLFVELESGISDHRGAAVDLDFQTADYYAEGETVAVTDLLSISRASTGYAPTSTGTLTSFSDNTPRITDLGFLCEDSRTNVVLWNRDLTNGAWTATNVTTAKDQTGPDGVANSASKITASAGNGTILQSITLASSARFQSAYVKRITGSGTINMTMDNGSTWTAITVTGSWARVTIPTQTIANPTVGFRIVTSGDAIAVDFVQNENGAVGTSPIATTTVSATRAADGVTVAGSLDTILQSSAKTVILDAILENAGDIQNLDALLGQISPQHVFLYNNTEVNQVFASGTGAANTTATSGGPTWTTGAKAGVACDGSGFSIVMGAGTVVVDSVYPINPTAACVMNVPNAAVPPGRIYFRRLKVWDTRLADTTLQSLTAP